MFRTATAIAIAVGLGGCSKPQHPSAVPPPPQAASAAPAATMSVEDMVRSARIIMSTLQSMPIKGEFEDIKTKEDISRLTDATENYRWPEFSQTLPIDLNGPSAYRSSLGSFLVFTGVTKESSKRIGLVINLANHRTSIYTIGDHDVSPSGDSLANALVIGLEIEESAKKTFDQPPTKEQLRAHTLNLIDETISRFGRTDGEPDEKPSNAAQATEARPEEGVPLTTGTLKFAKGLSLSTLKKWYSVSQCGVVDKVEMCMGTNTLNSPPPILLGSRGLVCLIGKPVQFTILNGSMSGVRCETSDELWQASGTMMTGDYGPATVTNKPFQSINLEEHVWVRDGLRYSVARMFGSSLRGDPVNQLMVSIQVVGSGGEGKQ